MGGHDKVEYNRNIACVNARTKNLKKFTQTKGDFTIFATIDQAREGNKFVGTSLHVTAHFIKIGQVHQSNLHYATACVA